MRKFAYKGYTHTNSSGTTKKPKNQQKGGRSVKNHGIYIPFDRSVQLYLKLQLSGLRYIASTGQMVAHTPQSTQLSFIVYGLALLIASTGHSGSHLPHSTQVSVIMYAILFSPLTFNS